MLFTKVMSAQSPSPFLACLLLFEAVERVGEGNSEK
jgi:hypothetical protein